MADYNGFRETRKTVYEDNFTIRNSVIDAPPDNSDVGRLILGVTDPNGVGVVENCMIHGGGVYLHPSYHKGTIWFKNCYVRQCPDNGLYADEPAGALAGRSNYGGVIHVRNCYFEDNNISHVRLNAGSSVKDTIIRNTGNVPVHNNGGHNSRGLHTFYGKGDFDLPPPVAENVHIDTTDTSGYGSAFAVNKQGKNAPNPVWEVRSSELRGNVFDKSRIDRQSVGNNPRPNPPNKVPMTFADALDGDASADPGYVGGSGVMGSGGSAAVFLPPGSSESLLDWGDPVKQQSGGPGVTTVADPWTVWENIVDFLDSGGLQAALLVGVLAVFGTFVGLWVAANWAGAKGMKIADSGGGN